MSGSTSRRASFSTRSGFPENHLLPTTAEKRAAEHRGPFVYRAREAGGRAKRRTNSPPGRSVLPSERDGFFSVVGLGCGVPRRIFGNGPGEPHPVRRLGKKTIRTSGTRKTCLQTCQRRRRNALNLVFIRLCRRDGRFFPHQASGKNSSQGAGDFVCTVFASLLMAE